MLPHRFEASATPRLVIIGVAYDDRGRVLAQTLRVLRILAAALADGSHFLYLVGQGTEPGHHIERHAVPGHIETRDIDLQVPVAELFTAVMVNDPDLVVRQNRHALLQAVREVVLEVADFAAFQIG